MTRTEAALALAGGAIGGAAAITGMWIGRNLTRRDITAPVPYDQSATITRNIGRLITRRKAASA